MLITRLFLHKVETEHRKKMRSWLDRMLVKWASVFASYIKGDEDSFALPNKMKFLPQFVYYLRRTPLFRRAGISLDELTYQSHILNREKITNCITII